MTSFRSVLIIILQLAGSLCFLLYGMKLMSDGIQKSAGDKLQKALHFMTRNRFVGLITGCLLTMLIQSSGATTVMLVSFVNAGLLTLEQSIGVIFGANIGTTITAWIVALFGSGFEIKDYAIPIFGLGYVFLIMKKLHKEGIGQAIMGFGMLFIGLGWLSDIIKSTSFLPDLIESIQGIGIWSMVFAVLIGIIFTALIHSSSAMTAIVITLCAVNSDFWELGAAMVIGSEIGSTVDSIMAAFGSSSNAKRTAFVHVMFNVITVILALAFFKPFLAFIDLIVPGTVQENIVYHIAMLHTMFKVFGTVLFIPFVNQIANLTRKIIRDDSDNLPTVYKFEFSELAAHEAPTIPVVTASHEVSKMADIAVQMFDRLQYGFKDRSGSFLKEHYDNLVREEDYMDQMQEQITNYLLKCLKLDLDDRTRNNVNVMIQITQELESMSDDVLSIGVAIKKMTEKNYSYPEEDYDRLLPYLELARQLLMFIYKNINKALNANQMEFANELETQIDQERKELKKVARKRLEAGANVKAELVYMDFVKQIEKIGDCCFSIAEQLSLTE